MGHREGVGIIGERPLGAQRGEKSEGRRVKEKTLLPANTMFYLSPLTYLALPSPFTLHPSVPPPDCAKIPHQPHRPHLSAAREPPKAAMTELTSTQRKYLRKIGQKLDPVIIVGKQGVTDMLVRAVTQALEAHELVKVRFNEFKDEKRTLAEEIERRTGSHIAGMIGHVALFYKQQPDEDKRKIEFPRA